MENLALMPKYEAYKDSGIEWMEQIPEGWEIARIKNYANVFSGDSLNDKQKSQYESDDLRHRPYISSKDIDVNYSKINYLNGLRIPKGSSHKVCPSNSTLLCIEGGSAGKKIAYTNQDVCFVNKLACFVANKGIDSHFLYYYLSSVTFKNQFFNAMTGLIGGVSISSIKNFCLLLPSTIEQAMIASFLNKKISQIDESIVAKEQQISLLKERKQIIIQQAVSQGLDPNVPMKDSGVDWIGKIPEHWDRPNRMKYIATLKGRQGWQGLKAEEYRDEGPHVLSSAHFNNYVIDWDKCPRVSYERYLMDENIQLKVGDILLMKDGANMGKLAFVDSLPGLACLNSHLLIFRTRINSFGKEFFSHKYMYFHMMCDEFQDFVKVNGTGSTFLGISQESLGNYPICLPPLTEQLEIVSYLEVEIRNHNAAICQYELQIEKLKEYKTSLINSAVTGKIKITPEMLEQ